MGIVSRPGHYNFVVNQGATFRLLLTWKDENGDPTDLTNATASLVISKIQKLPGQSDVQQVLELTDQSGLTLGDDAGTILIEMDDVTTAGIDWDTDHARGVYDLYVTLQDATVTRLLDGSVILERKLGA